MTKYHVGDAHWKGAPIGNIRILSEPYDSDSILRYLIKDEDGTWSWWADSDPAGKSNIFSAFNTFEGARCLGDHRMFVVAVDEPVLFRVGDRVQYTRTGTLATGWVGTVVLSDWNPDVQVRVEWDNGEGMYTTPLVHNLARYTDPEPEPVSVRAQILRRAEEIVSKDRNASYGEPEDNFARIAEFWTTFLSPKLKDGETVTSGDTAVLMILVKLAREMNAPTIDNKIDIAGYAACLGQVDHPDGL